MRRPILVAGLATLTILAGSHNSLPSDVAIAAPAWRPAHELILVTADEPGLRLVIDGRVVSRADSRTPLAGVHVHVYHQDARGRYNLPAATQPRLSGRFTSGADGRYRIRTIVPGTAEGTPHVHVEIFDAAGRRVDAFSLNLCRTHGAGSDKAFEKILYYASLPESRHPGYWSHVEQAADSGFVVHWDMPVPPDAGAPAR